MLRELLELIDERDKLERKKMANMKRSACCATLLYVLCTRGGLTWGPHILYTYQCVFGHWALGWSFVVLEFSGIEISISFECNTDTRCALAFEHTDMCAGL